MIILTPRKVCERCGSKAQVEQTSHHTQPYHVYCTNEDCDNPGQKASRVADAIEKWNYDNGGHTCGPEVGF